MTVSASNSGSSRAGATPWLSVIMPTYNGERYLAAALESIRSQGDSEIEVLAVNDGSTDGTLEILRQHSPSLPLVVVDAAASAIGWPIRTTGFRWPAANISRCSTRTTAGCRGGWPS